MADKKILKSTLRSAIKRAVAWLRIHRAVIFLGGPGLGKSGSIREQLCIELAKFHEGFDKLPVLQDLRLSYREGVDLRGYGKVDEEAGTTKWYVPEEFPTEGPGIIFIDEITQAEKSAAHSAYQLVLEGRLAEYEVPEGVYIVAAGNRPEDGCNLRKFDAGLRQRFAFIEIEPSAAEWREDFAIPNGVMDEIIVATNFYPELIEGFDGKRSEQQSTARELTALSNVLESGDVEDDEIIHYAVDVVGETAALQLAPFIKAFDGIIPLRTVWETPKEARIPDYNEFDTAISVTIALAKSTEVEDVANALVYIDRLEDQYRALFATIFPRVSKGNALRAPAWETWSVRNHDLTV